METELHEVGLQLWRGALLLGDFILDRQKNGEFKDVVAIELGAGIGLSGFCMARTAKRVFLTDYSDEVLDNCRRNIDINDCTLNRDDHQHIFARRLDWTVEPEHNPLSSSYESTTTCTHPSPYDWTPEDIRCLKECQIFLAADVIYDDVLTDSLFQLLKSTPRGVPGRKLYLAMEKRFNFCFDGTEARLYSAAHEHLMRHIKGDGTIFEANQVDMDFPMRFEYERGPDLELWEISCMVIDGTMHAHIGSQLFNL
ncbi:hypothetical protein PROFUN_04748 [Planoprotostelium fungivorum]|uniref:Methyltransferase-like protein 22 n=1 Tax=Planoprotostelium fungivorum TaxID=1890364 RepID=A0A2P6NG23_9EUKA|nr:hypothetical protein PROFUN_04748 [Planoprotostelium fungivorum]